jgi:signal transduction histidine kinase
VDTSEAWAASIAHEVIQPLSGIITNASACLQMLAADPPNLEGARETARRTIRDGERASDLVRRLRTVFGKKLEMTESVDLNEVTRDAVALTRSELQRAKVQVRMELADKLPRVTGDPLLLHQVMVNLLLNASHAMSGIEDRPRRLVVATARDAADRALASVQDNGVGIDPDGKDRLFEAFYTSKSNGMGIGLAVSRAIIESHRGRLWAKPNRGPGATFSFSIPMAE